MRRHIEDALAACGRDRVMHRDCGHGDHRPSVAIRFDRDALANATAPDGTTKFLVRNGDDLDQAGHLAAADFAARLRDIARDFDAWAGRIEAALKRGAL